MQFSSRSQKRTEGDGSKRWFSASFIAILSWTTTREEDRVRSISFHLLFSSLSVCFSSSVCIINSERGWRRGPGEVRVTLFFSCKRLSSDFIHESMVQRLFERRGRQRETRKRENNIDPLLKSDVKMHFEFGIKSAFSRFLIRRNSFHGDFTKRERTTKEWIMLFDFSSLSCCICASQSARKIARL